MIVRWDRILHQALIILFHLLIISVPFVFTWVNEELFEFNKMIATYALTLGIAGLWTGRMLVERRIIFRRTIFDIPLALFLISQILSTIFSIHPYTSIFGYYTRFHGGLLSTITYLILYYAFVSNVSKRQLPGIFISTLVVAIGVSLYAIPEHFGHSPSCFLINKGQSFDVSCWIQDVKHRIFGTFGQPNWLAAYAITLILWAAGLLGWSFESDDNRRPTYQRWFKALTIISLLLLFVTLVYTRSRSGIIGLGLGGLLFGLGAILITWRQVKKFGLRFSQTALPWLIGLAAICLVFFVISGDDLVRALANNLGLSTSISQPVSTTSPETTPVNRLETGITDSADIRKIVWQGAIDIGRRYPLFGSGVETFAYSYYQDRPVEHNLVSEWDFLYNKAHNEFLNFFATTGVVGLTAYSLVLLWIVGICSYYLVKAKSLNLANHWLLLGTTTAIVALSVSNFFGFSTVMVSILLFLLPAMVVVALNDDHPQFGHWLDRSETKKSTTTDSGSLSIATNQWLLLATLALIVGYGWFMIYTWWSADYNYAMGKQYFKAGYYTEGMTLLQTAMLQSPQEALYYDELAANYSLLASSLFQEGDATTAAQLAQAAIVTSDKTIELNNRHLNFYKSRARIFINLATLDEAYFQRAKETLQTAVSLAPTDAKLMYNLALVEDALGERELAVKQLEAVIAAKSNYEGARAELARYYQEAGRYTDALEQYTYILTNIAPNNENVQQQRAALEALITTQSAQPS